MKEETFKIVLNSLWHCFTASIDLENNSELVGLTMENNPGYLSEIYGIQNEITALIDLCEADRNAVGSDKRRLTFEEEFMQFMYVVRTMYPNQKEFPKNAYSGLLNLFTKAGFKLPWNKSDTYLLISMDDIGRELTCDLFPTKEAAWKSMLNNLLAANKGEFKNSYEEDRNADGYVNDSSEYGIDADSAWANGNINYDWKIFQVN